MGIGSLRSAPIFARLTNKRLRGIAPKYRAEDGAAHDSPVLAAKDAGKAEDRADLRLEIIVVGLNRSKCTTCLERGQLFRRRLRTITVFAAIAVLSGL